MTAATLGYSPGVGASVATDQDGGGAHHQKAVVEYLQAGVPTPAARETPMPVAVYGEMLEAIEALRMAVHSLSRNVGMAYPDSGGRLRVNVETGALTASLAASQTLATLTNQTQIGGNAANDQVPSLMHLQADSLRRNITVT